MFFAIVIYAAAIILANHLVSVFGPAITPVNAFVLIGLDLALRDWLHFKLKVWQMGALIFTTGAITYLLNPAAEQIAVASAVAFTVAAVVDWLVFAKLKGNWMVRSNASNSAGAAVDSLVFPTLAFGSLMPSIVIAQFVAKVAGGFVWSLVINRLNGCWSARLGTGSPEPRFTGWPGGNKP